MKKCPKCGELIGDKAESCFNCFFNFNQGRVLNSQEIKSQRDKDVEIIIKTQNRQEELEKLKEAQLPKNPIYEYKVEIITDNSDGTISDSQIQGLLSQYSLQGWKLHSMVVNEVGKSATSTMIGFLGLNVNATIDQTILIFERCIKAES